jgi:glyoxylase-like metal-dependent hydrolase (beta-lactamase superfamily II)
MPRLLIFALFLAAPALAQQDLSKVEIRAEKLSDTLYMLTGAGGNIGLSAGNDAVFLVDDQFAPLTPRIQAAIAKVTPKPVSFVLNTHWHFDHTGGNQNFGKAGALIDSRPTAEFDAVWGKGFLNAQRFVEMLYKNLQTPR